MKFSTTRNQTKLENVTAGPLLLANFSGDQVNFFLVLIFENKKSVFRWIGFRGHAKSAKL